MIDLKDLIYNFNIEKQYSKRFTRPDFIDINGSVHVMGVRGDERRVAGLGRLSAGANMAMKPFVKRVITIFATNASFLRVISIFRI